MLVPQTQSTHTTCTRGWLASDDGSAMPACVCPVIGSLASALYWTLPASRRGGFDEIEAALCGTRTDDDDELARRLLRLLACSARVNGKPAWMAEPHEQDVLELLHARRYTKGFESWVVATSDALTSSVCAGGPVSAWLALDDLADLLVSTQVRQ